jgi:Family of unknown function (DUF6364)
MSNLTLAIDDQLLKRARSYAQSRGTTLNALVRSLLEREVRPPIAPDFIERLEEISRHGNPEPGWKFSREETYAERLDRYPKRDRLAEGPG